MKEGSFMKNFGILCLITLFLVGCGNRSRSLEAFKEDKTLDSPKTDPSQNHQLQTDDEIFQVEHIEPLNNSVWRRRIKLKLPNSQFVRVEKFVNNYWQNFTYTDENSTFEDSDISKNTKYRIKGEVESSEFEGVYDFDLSRLGLCLKSDQEIKAYRVIVPKNFVLFIDKFNLKILAHIFRLDGEIKSFEADPKNGASSGTLLIHADKIQGSGHVLLSGASGQAGAQGAPGLTRDIQDLELLRGKDGQVGGDGGRGGNIYIFYSQLLEVPQDFFQSLGGVAGRGGAPGIGGLDAGQSFHDARLNRGGGVHGPSGKEGLPGASGIEGLVLFKKILINNKNSTSTLSKIIDVSEIPPSSFGGEWIRKLHVNLNHEQIWPVEKRSINKDWVPAGFTDELGNYYDRETSQRTQYRVAKHYESQIFFPMDDLDLSQVLGRELKKNEFIKAHRVFLRKGDTLSLKQFNLNIEADYFQIDGSIVSYETDLQNGASSGSLFVYAKNIIGQGEIKLKGFRGRDGLQGQQGLPFYHDYVNPIPPKESEGKVGSSGALGGRGGDLIMISDASIKLEFSKIDLLGGTGGQGGPGGPGGLSFTEFLDTFHFGPSRWIFANFGSHGEPGKEGHSGLLHWEILKN